MRNVLNVVLMETCAIGRPFQLSAPDTDMKSPEVPSKLWTRSLFGCSDAHLVKPLVRALIVLVLALAQLATACARPRWSQSEANEWYSHQPWYVGVNFVPSSAVNQLEMFQADTFD